MTRVLRAAFARTGTRPPGAPVAWVADRAGDAVYGLDRHAIVVRRIPVVAPVAVEALASGGVRVVAAAAGRAGGARVARVFDPDGRERGAPRFAGLGGRVEGRPGARRGPNAWDVAFRGRDVRAWIAEPPRGGVTRLWLARDHPRAGSTALERWIDRGSGPRRAFRIRVPGDVRVLVADGTDGALRAVGCRALTLTHVDGRGVPHGSWAWPDAEGASAAALDGDSVLWIAAAGALVRVGPDGLRRPGQGGFAHLVDLSLADR